MQGIENHVLFVVRVSSQSVKTLMPPRRQGIRIQVDAGRSPFFKDDEEYVVDLCRYKTVADCPCIDNFEDFLSSCSVIVPAEHKRRKPPCYQLSKLPSTRQPVCTLGTLDDTTYCENSAHVRAYGVVVTSFSELTV